MDCDWQDYTVDYVMDFDWAQKGSPVFTPEDILVFNVDDNMVGGWMNGQQFVGTDSFMKLWSEVDTAVELDEFVRVDDVGGNIYIYMDQDGADNSQVDPLEDAIVLVGAGTATGSLDSLEAMTEAGFKIIVNNVWLDCSDCCPSEVS
jgi:hypothetical protein